MIIYDESEPRGQVENTSGNADMYIIQEWKDGEVEVQITIRLRLHAHGHATFQSIQNQTCVTRKCRALNKLNSIRESPSYAWPSLS